MTSPSIGYTYLIKFLPTGQVYYGSRCGKNCNPSEFWVKYFTSSKVVKNLIKEHGKESFVYEIRKTFNDPKDAQKWERKVLRRMDVARKSYFLNKSNGVAPILSGWKNPFFMKKHTEQTKQKMKENQPNKNGEKNPNWKGGKDRRKFKGDEIKRKQAQSDLMKIKNPMLNEEVRKKHTEAISKRKTYACEHCGKVLNLGGYTVHRKALLKNNIIINDYSGKNI